MDFKTPLVVEIFISVLVRFIIAPLTKILDKLGLYKRIWIEIGKRGPLNSLTPSFGDYQPTQHDVIVCTFSKSGTNWMLQIAHQIAHRGQADYDHIHDVIPWPDSGPLPTLSLNDTQQVALSPVNLRVIKTHSSFEYVPYSEDAKYITVIRDPKEVLVSSYHFVKSALAGSMMPSVQTWVDLYVLPHFILGGWAEHTASYWAIRDRDNVMLLTFHELKLDSERYIHEVANFLDVKLTEDELAMVLEKSSFPYMKAIDAKFAPKMKPPWLSQSGTLIRSGKSGASSELLSPKQQEMIDNHMQAELQRLGSDFPYAEMFLRN